MSRTFLFSLILFTQSALAADDDHWDTRFGAPGVDGLVNGITCAGTNVYLTGMFATAGDAPT